MQENTLTLRAKRKEAASLYCPRDNTVRRGITTELSRYQLAESKAECLACQTIAKYTTASE